MKDVTVWHNPRCSKSREAIKIVEESGCDAEVVKYLETNPDKETLTNLLKMLDLTPRELMRTKEAIYKELKLKDESNDEKLIEAMVENPKLIERPVLIKDGKAIIGRPTERISEFLNS